MTDDKKLPGVRLWLEGCSQRASVLEPTAVNFTMNVHGQALNEDIFNKVKKKFEEGFEVYTVEDLKGQMIKILKEDNATYEQRIRDLEVQLMNERKAHLRTREDLQKVQNTMSFLKGSARNR